MTRVSLSTFAIICMLHTVIKSPAQAYSARAVDSGSEAWKRIPEATDDGDPKFGQIFLRKNSMTFGQIVEEYPEATIKQLLSEASPLIRQYLKRAKVPGFGNRHNSFDSSEHEGMCRSIQSVQHPEKLQNTKGEWKTVVNVDKNYQPVYTEICKKQVTCSLKEYFPLEYESECKQKYSVKRLLVAVDKDLVWDNFDIPCGCICAIKRPTPV